MILLKRLFNYFLIYSLIIHTLFLPYLPANAANITDIDYLVPDGSTNTVTDRAQNGTPIVNIAAPSGAGVSLNNYSDYNVTNENQVLNNYKGIAVDTTIAGQIYGNPNFAPSHVNQASVIVNQVTSTKRSRIMGSTEVAGGRAEVVVVNPNGMDVGGASYINTSRLSLVSGKVNMQNGAIKNYDLSQSQGANIIITGVNTPDYVNLGLNAADADFVDIISRSVEILGDIHVKGDLNFRLGNKNYDYSTGTITSDSSLGNATTPSFALDSSYLGGMYAGRISLIASEDGIGVRTRGDLTSKVSDIDFNVQGNIDYERVDSNTNINFTSNQGKITGGNYATTSRPAITYAKGNIIFDGATGIELNDSSLDSNFYAAGNINLTSTNGLIKNNSTVKADGTLTTSSASLENTSLLFSADNLSITTTGQFKNTSGSIESSKNVTVNSGSFNNAALIKAGVDAILTSSTNFIDTSQIKATRDLTITANTGISYNDLYSGRNSNLTNNTSGDITQNYKLYSLGTTNITNNGGNITFGITDNTNNGSLYAKEGLTILSSADITNNTNIFSEKNIDITANNLTNNIRIMAVGSLLDDNIISNLTINLDTNLLNRGLLFAKNDANLNVAGTVTNDGNYNAEIFALKGNVNINGKKYTTDYGNVSKYDFFYLSFDKSTEIWNDLLAKGYIDADGNLTDAFKSLASSADMAIDGSLASYKDSIYNSLTALSKKIIQSGSGNNSLDRIFKDFDGKATDIYNALVVNGYVDSSGNILQKFYDDTKTNGSDGLSLGSDTIINNLKSDIFALLDDARNGKIIENVFLGISGGNLDTGLLIYELINNGYIDSQGNATDTFNNLSDHSALNLSSNSSDATKDFASHKQDIFNQINSIKDINKAKESDFDSITYDPNAAINDSASLYSQLKTEGFLDDSGNITEKYHTDGIASSSTLNGFQADIDNILGGISQATLSNNSFRKIAKGLDNSAARLVGELIVAGYLDSSGKKTSNFNFADENAFANSFDSVASGGEYEVARTAIFNKLNSQNSDYSFTDSDFIGSGFDSNVLFDENQILFNNLVTNGYISSKGDVNQAFYNLSSNYNNLNLDSRFDGLKDQVGQLINDTAPTRAQTSTNNLVNAAQNATRNQAGLIFNKMVAKGYLNSKGDFTQKLMDEVINYYGDDAQKANQLQLDEYQQYASGVFQHLKAKNGTTEIKSYATKVENIKGGKITSSLGDVNIKAITFDNVSKDSQNVTTNPANAVDSPLASGSTENGVNRTSYRGIGWAWKNTVLWGYDTVSSNLYSGDVVGKGGKRSFTRAGRNINIETDNVLNNSAIITAANDLNIRTTNLKNTRTAFTVSVPYIYETHWKRRSVGRRWRWKEGRYHTWNWSSVLLRSNTPSILSAGNNLNISAIGDVRIDAAKVDNTIAAPSQSSSNPNNPTSDSWQVNVPTGNNGLFKKAAPESRYLIESAYNANDPNYLSGSQYYKERFGFDPNYNNVKWLGDPFYEWNVINEQILKAEKKQRDWDKWYNDSLSNASNYPNKGSGIKCKMGVGSCNSDPKSSVTNSVNVVKSSDNLQLEPIDPIGAKPISMEDRKSISFEKYLNRLIDNAYLQKNELNLVPGVKLTERQVAALREDIIWYEEEEIMLADGSLQKVLTPRVYLAEDSFNKMTLDESAMIASNININAGGSLTNEGKIIATATKDNPAGGSGNLDIKVAGDLTNKSLIKADNYLGLKADNIINESTVNTLTLRHGSGYDVRSELAKTAMIEGGNINIEAITDFTNLAANIAAKQNDLGNNQTSNGNLSITAGDDINIGTLELKNRVERSWGNKKKGGRSLDETVTNLASNISSVGSLTLITTGNGTDAETQKANEEYQAALAKYNSDLAQYDKDLQSYKEALANYESLKSQGGLKSLALRDPNPPTKPEEPKLETFLAKNNAGSNIDIIGSNVTSENNIILASRNDVNIEAAQNTSYSARSSWKRGTTTFKSSNSGTSQITNLLSKLDSTKGDISIFSGSDTNIIGGKLKSENVAINAGEELNLYSVSDQSSSWASSTKSRDYGGIVGGNLLATIFAITYGTAGVKSVDKSIVRDKSSVVSSVIESGGDVSLTSNLNLTISGSNISGKRGNIASNQGSVNILSAAESDTIRSSTKSTKGRSALTLFTKKKDSTHSQTSRVTNVSSNLIFEDDLSVATRGVSNGLRSDIQIQGSNLKTKTGDLNLDSSGNVIITNAVDSVTNSSFSNKKGSVKKVTSMSLDHSETAISSNLESGNDLNINANSGTLLLQGSNTKAVNDTAFNTKNTIISDAILRNYSYSAKTKESRGIAKGFTAVTSALITLASLTGPGLLIRLGSELIEPIDGGFSKDLQKDIRNSQFSTTKRKNKANGSSLVSVGSNVTANNIILTSTEDTTIKASKIDADESLTVNAENLELLTTKEQSFFDRTENSRRTFTFKNYSDGGNQTNNIVNPVLKAQNNNITFNISGKVNSEVSEKSQDFELAYRERLKSQINSENLTLNQIEYTQSHYSDTVRGLTEAGQAAIAIAIAAAVIVSGGAAAPAAAAAAAGGGALGVAAGVATAGAVAAGTAAATQATISGTNASMNVDGDFAKQVKSTSKITWDQTTDDEALKSYAISAIAAAITAGVLQGTEFTTSSANTATQATTQATNQAATNTTTQATTQTTTQTANAANSANSISSNIQRFASNFNNAATKVTISQISNATATSLVKGGSWKDNFEEGVFGEDAFKQMLIQAIGEAGAREIGNLAHGKVVTNADGTLTYVKPTIGKGTQLALHGALGCGLGVAGGGDCASGAVSGMIGEMTAESLDRNTNLSNGKIIQLSGLTGGLSAIFTSNAVGLDDSEVAKNISSGNFIGGNAAANNYIQGKMMDDHMELEWLEGRLTDSEYANYKQARQRGDQLAGNIALGAMTLGEGAVLLQGGKAIIKRALTAKLGTATVNGVAGASGGAWGSYVGGGDAKDIARDAIIYGSLGFGSTYLGGSSNTNLKRLASGTVTGSITGGVSSNISTRFNNPNANNQLLWNNTLEGVIGGGISGLTTTLFTPVNSGVWGSIVGAEMGFVSDLFISVPLNRYDLIKIDNISNDY